MQRARLLTATVVALSVAIQPALAIDLPDSLRQYVQDSGASPTEVYDAYIQHHRLPREFRRQVVTLETSEVAGTIIIDSGNHFLYFVLGDGRALRFGIGTGKEGFGWKGTQRVSKKREWPDWTPPAEMLKRRPDLPRHMAGGLDNPLGARALYLGSTLYRIHGTNEPWTIGSDVSSGCIRMTNEDVAYLYPYVQIGTKVIVL